jgi:eukaryotic-like serine/threonine-protein kinase
MRKCLPFWVSPDVGSNTYGAEFGDLLWEVRMGDLSSTPAVDGGDAWSLYAIEAATGRVLWKYKFGGIVGTASVANGVVYAQSQDRNLYAVDASTGQGLWSVTTLGASAAPTIADGVVYADSSRGVRAYWLP